MRSAAAKGGGVRQICREQIWSHERSECARRAEHRMCSDNPSPPAKIKGRLPGGLLFCPGSRDEDPNREAIGVDKFVGNKFERDCAQRSEPEGPATGCSR